MHEKNLLYVGFEISLIIFLFVAFTVAASAEEIYVPDDKGTISEAVNAANPGDSIIVRDGIYTENVLVDKTLTIRSENGSTSTIVKAPITFDDYIFNVEEDYVNISGFTVTSSNGILGYSGIHLLNANNCNISNNIISDNQANGIELDFANNNKISENNISENGNGISSVSSSYNKISKNTISNNSITGLYQDFSSNYNEITENKIKMNEGQGILVSGLITSPSHYNNISYNLIENNTDTGVAGISLLWTENSIIRNNTLLNNDFGIYLFDSNYNEITKNTILKNIEGFRLISADNNEITCNFVAFNKRNGFYLTSGGFTGSTDNNISFNNIIANGVLSGTSWQYNFNNSQPYDVDAKNNYWGTNDQNQINESIFDYYDDASRGKVNFSGYTDSPVPCAPIPELSTTILFGFGLGLLSFLRYKKKEKEK